MQVGREEGGKTSEGLHYNQCTSLVCVYLGGQRRASSRHVRDSRAQKLSSTSILLTTSPQHSPGERGRVPNAATKLSRLGVYGGGHRVGRNMDTKEMGAKGVLTSIMPHTLQLSNKIEMTSLSFLSWSCTSASHSTESL